MTHPQPLKNTIDQLYQAIEDLHITQEELRQQNEELVSMRDMIDAERQRYQELFELAPDGYVVTNENAIIQEANQAMAQLLNLPQFYLVGKPLSLYIVFTERQVFRSGVNRLKFGQVDRIGEWEIFLQPRHRQCIQVSITVSRVSRPTGISLRWIIRNISERKEAEAQVQKIHLENLRLQETARLKSQVLATVSHDLRSPLTAILGFSQVLLRQPQESLSDKQRNMITKIHRNGESLLVLINDILELSTLESRKLKLKLEPINLEEFIFSIVEDVSSLTFQKNLSLKTSFHGEDPVIITDQQRLRQIIVNLVSNAIKFTEKGVIKIEALHLKDQPDDFMVIVQDTGIGMTPEDLNNIFEAFYQIESGYGSEVKGTGLGLAIVRSLVEQMKGTIKVQSKIGEGSVFQVKLPCKFNPE